MKKKVLLSSILTIVLCLSLIAGSTFALFTSTSDVNIAITAGKVNVVASLSEPILESVEPVADDTVLPSNPEENGFVQDEKDAWYKYQVRTNGKFYNEGTATVKNGTLTIERITPGDKVSFNVNVANNSDVAVAYRFIVETTEGHALMYGMNVTVNDKTYASLDTYTAAWAYLDAEENINDIEITVELPVDAGNEYQKLSAAINVKVEAVQSNANLPAEEKVESVKYIEKIESLDDIKNALATGEITAVVLRDVINVDDTGLTLENVTVDASNGQDAALYVDNDVTTITLNAGAEIIAPANYFGILSMGYGYGTTIVVEEGAKITADANGAAIYIYGTPADGQYHEIYLNGSDLLDGSIILGGAGRVNIHVTSDELIAEYAPLVDGTATEINWYVNGTLVNP